MVPHLLARRVAEEALLVSLAVVLAEYLVAVDVASQVLESGGRHLAVEVVSVGDDVLVACKVEVEFVFL